MKKYRNKGKIFLKIMLKGFNEGRSKSYYCTAATVLELEELQEALARAKEESKRSNISDKSDKISIKVKSKLLHLILDNIAAEKNYLLKLRK